MYEAYAFFITGLVYELGPPDSFNLFLNSINN